MYSADFNSMINVLEEVLDTIEAEEFDKFGNISKTLDDCFMELCGEYPGAVSIRNSYTNREKLKVLDQETTEVHQPLVAKGGGGAREREKTRVIPKISWNLIRRKKGK
jgi:hypothetical protein